MNTIVETDDIDEQFNDTIRKYGLVMNNVESSRLLWNDLYEENQADHYVNHQEAYFAKAGLINTMFAVATGAQVPYSEDVNLFSLGRVPDIQRKYAETVIAMREAHRIHIPDEIRAMVD